MPNETPEIHKAIPQEVEKAHGATGYMCAIDFECELGCASGGNTVYPSINDLMRRHPTWEECGIVEVKVCFSKMIFIGEALASKAQEA